MVEERMSSRARRGRLSEGARGPDGGCRGQRHGEAAFGDGQVALSMFPDGAGEEQERWKWMREGRHRGDQEDDAQSKMFSSCASSQVPFMDSSDKGPLASTREAEFLLTTTLPEIKAG